MTSGARVNYTYAQGRRVKKSNGRLYWYGAGSEVLAESDLAGNFSDEYMFFPSASLGAGSGKRVQKSNGKLYWYGAGSDPLAESNAAGTISDEYIFFGGKRVGRRKVATAEINYYFADHLGSSRVVTNATGSILDDSDFYPFGGERPVTSSSGNAYKFTGKERDSESGLDNFGARYFGSNMGRFMSPDEFWKDSHVGDPQSWNKYAYARNNPLRYVDPTGEKATVSTSCTTNADNQTTCNVNIQASI